MNRVNGPRDCHLVEIFSGIQGEGIFVGERHLFVRLAGCNLDCAYCDTPQSREPSSECKIEQIAASRMFDNFPSPIPVITVCNAIDALNSPRGLHDALVLTGGEPLVQADVVAELSQYAKTIGLRTMLETNGTLSAELDRVLGSIDIISMDIKITSSGEGKDRLNDHHAFLCKAVAKNVYVKIVVTATSIDSEIEAAVRMIGSVSRDVPLVLQPVTSDNRSMVPSPGRMLSLQEKCKGILPRILVIPQCHKFMGQL